MHLFALNPSWLSCKIWCLSPYVDKMDVSVLVKNLYIVFANAIGFWLLNKDGFSFCKVILLSLFSGWYLF